MRKGLLLLFVSLIIGCSSGPAEDGLSSLIRMEQEPPGENCAYGGEVIMVGLDTNRDGMLSEDEVQDTAYLCASSTGETYAAGALVDVSDEPPGANCAAGGMVVSWGQDLNADGQLGADEVQGQSYVCNGEAGASGDDGTTSLVSIEPLEAGDDCPAGGQTIATGEDINGDGVLQPDEIISTTYVCNGEAGTSGHVSLVVQSPEPAGDNCAAGGTRVDSGMDLNDDGTLEEDEIQATTYVCNGVSSLIRVTTEPAGEPCTYGGTRVDVGLDDGDTPGHAGDGTLEDDEVDDTFYICDAQRPLAGFQMMAADEDYFAFPPMAGFTAGGSWAILEAIELPDNAQPGWHFFRGKAWEDQEGDVALQVNLDAAPPQVQAWVQKSGWVNINWADDSGDVLRSGRVITFCLQYDAGTETAQLYVDGVLRTEASIAGGIDDSANTNPLYFGGQAVDSSYNQGDLYTEADVVMIHQAWLTRILTAEEIAQYSQNESKSFVVDGTTFFATRIGEDADGDMNFYDAVSGEYATIGNTPEYLVLE